MNEPRISLEKLQDMLREDGSMNGLTGNDSNVNDSRSVTPGDAADLMRIIGQVEMATDAAMSHQEKDMIFQRAWKWSAPPEKEKFSWMTSISKMSWLNELVMKPAFVFATGIAAGVWLTVNYQNGSLDIATQAQADEPIQIEKGIYRNVVTGSAVTELYSYMENPRIEVEKSRDGSIPEKRVVYGSLDNNSITLVLNF